MLVLVLAASGTKRASAGAAVVDAMLRLPALPQCRVPGQKPSSVEARFPAVAVVGERPRSVGPGFAMLNPIG